MRIAARPSACWRPCAKNCADHLRVSRQIRQRSGSIVSAGLFVLPTAVGGGKPVSELGASTLAPGSPPTPSRSTNSPTSQPVTSAKPMLLMSCGRVLHHVSGSHRDPGGFDDCFSGRQPSGIRPAPRQRSRWAYLAYLGAHSGTAMSAIERISVTAQKEVAST